MVKISFRRPQRSYNVLVLSIIEINAQLGLFGPVFSTLVGGPAFSNYCSFLVLLFPVLHFRSIQLGPIDVLPILYAAHAAGGRIKKTSPIYNAVGVQTSAHR